jgi:hypothetical protein
MVSLAGLPGTLSGKAPGFFRLAGVPEKPYEFKRVPQFKIKNQKKIKNPPAWHSHCRLQTRIIREGKPICLFRVLLEKKSNLTYYTAGKKCSNF